jgi:hypothetical protein
MKRLAILLPLFALTLGCQKGTGKKADDDKPGTNDKPNIVGNGAGNLSVGGGGGGGGAAQAVRKAAARTVNENELKQLQLFISTAMTEDPSQKPPSADQIKDLIKQDGKLVALIKEEVIILTNSQNPSGIWAYTKWPQKAGKHYVVMASGVPEKTPDELTEALKAQGNDVKLEK